MMSQRQTGRLARWQLDLQQYDFKVAYIRGENNPVADCLSRHIDDHVQLMAMTRAQTQKLKSIDRNEGSDLLRKDIESQPVKKKHQNEAKELGSLYHSINWIKEQGKDAVLQKEARNPKIYEFKDGIVYRKKADNRKSRIVIPSHLVKEFIERVHGSKLCAHGGVEKTCYHMRSVWFPSIRRRLRDYCHSCYVCLVSKGMDNGHNVLNTRTPAELLERVYIDVVGPLPNDTSSYDTDNRLILTMMDDCSRFLRAVAIPNKSANVILQVFRDHWVSVFGIPKELISDRGKELIGDV